MNIQFNYCYRDGANYKQFGEVLFSNKHSMPLETVAHTIEQRLIDGMWFVASDWKLPDLYRYPYDQTIDHGWHEFESLEETSAAATTNNDIADWLQHVLKSESIS